MIFLYLVAQFEAFRSGVCETNPLYGAWNGHGLNIIRIEPEGPHGHS